MLIRGAEVSGRPSDLRLGKTILEIGRLRPQAGEYVLDAAGGAVIPGLHDHHVHLRAMAADLRSVPPDPASLRAAAAVAAPGAWLRAVGGYDGNLDRDGLDRVVADRPVRVQHRSGLLWTLNSEGLRLVGAQSCSLPGMERDDQGRPTGRLWRMDTWLRDRLGPGKDDFAELSRRAIRHGVTGFTDATPDRSQADVAALSQAEFCQRLVLMSPPGLSPAGHVELGPTKIVLNDRDLPDPEELAERITAISRAGGNVAVHCVTADQLVITTAALTAAGLPGARIEHAGVVPPGFAELLRELRATVVTQPAFVYERGDDYLANVNPVEQQWLYPCASLKRAGVPVAGSTDAPYADADPWPSVLAAIRRRTRHGRELNPGERVGPRDALGLFLGDPHDPATPRRVTPGARADLCLLRVPLGPALARPSRDHVAGIVVAGRWFAA